MAAILGLELSEWEIKLLLAVDALGGATIPQLDLCTAEWSIRPKWKGGTYRLDLLVAMGYMMRDTNQTPPIYAVAPRGREALEAR